VTGNWGSRGLTQPYGRGGGHAKSATAGKKAELNEMKRAPGRSLAVSPWRLAWQSRSLPAITGHGECALPYPRAPPSADAHSPASVPGSLHPPRQVARQANRVAPSYLRCALSVTGYACAAIGDTAGKGLFSTLSEGWVSNCGGMRRSTDRHL
jgi:hypothetical protein